MYNNNVESRPLQVYKMRLPHPFLLRLLRARPVSVNELQNWTVVTDQGEELHYTTAPGKYSSYESR